MDTISMYSKAKHSSKLPALLYPKRPDYSTFGNEITLYSNHFPIEMKLKFVHHYEVNIRPDDIPRSTARLVFQTMVKTHKNIFTNQRPVFDGKGNMISRRELLCLNNIVMQVRVEDSYESCIYQVRLKYCGKICLEPLNNALNPNSGLNVPKDALYAINLILRYAASLRSIAVGNSFYHPPLPHNHHVLGGGKEVWFGYHQSVNPCQWKPLLNIDVTATAFYEDLQMIDYVVQYLRINRASLRTLTEIQQRKILRDICGLKIEITHCYPAKRRYKICDLALPANVQTFTRKCEDNTTEEVTIERYFLEKYNLKLRYPNLPLLQVGQKERQTFLPMEVCKIVPGQRHQRKLNDTQTSNMIKITAKKAPQRYDEINRLVNRHAFRNDVHAKEFNLVVSNQMIQLRGRVLPSPRLLYGGLNQQNISPVNGTWDMRGKEFISSVPIVSWGIMSFASERYLYERIIKDYVSALRRTSRDIGMPILVDHSFVHYIFNVESVEHVLREIKQTHHNIQLLLVVMNGKNKVYSEVKRVGDTVLGIVTQCVQLANVVRPTIQPMSNLCMKINAKMGGLNGVLVPTVRTPVLMAPVIIMGAELSPGDQRRSAIAAVVASIDAHPNQYHTCVRIQPHEEDHIVDMKAMTRESLIMFKRNTRYKPERIIMYRCTSAPESKLRIMMTKELFAIREACLSLESDYKPGITYISIQRKHHTRLFCPDPETKYAVTDNVPSGTVVDTGVTRPSEYDFYLCSQAGLKGNSNPSYYHVLWDDNNIQANELHVLTYQLCHLNVRCTRSVSLPSPAYYAQLVATRARYHIMEKDGSVLNGSISPVSSDVEPHENFQNNGMYFI